MSTVTNNAITKIAAVTAGLAMFASFALVAPAQAALTSAQVQSILSLLTSFGADAGTIANVKTSLTGGTPAVTAGTTTTTSSACNFTMSLTIGSKGSDVTCLQTALIGAGYTIPAGATGYFGGQTRSAVAAWQKASNIAPAVGYFGSISRANWNLGGTTTTTATTPTTTTTALTGNGLKVALAAGSPNGTVIVQKQAIADLGEFTFSNPTSAAIKVTNLTFNRIGVSNDSTLTNVYLYNGVTRITDSAGVTASKFSYSNASGLFTVPAGSTYTVAVRSDIANSTSGQQLGVQLTAVGSNGTLDSSVSFPVVGGLQTVSAANLATVDFSSGTLPSGTSTVSPTADFVIWQNTVSVSTNPVKLSSMSFTNLGSIDASDLQNLRLYVDGTQVGTSIAQMGADRTVTFDMSASPITLSTASHIVKVLANVVGGSSRTFQLSLQRSSDAMFVDTQLNQPVTTTVSGSTFSAVSAGVRTVADAGTNGVSVTKAAASPTNDVPVGATNVKLASFNFLATGEPVKISDLYVYASVSATASENLTNGAIYVNGKQVGSTKDIGYSSTTKTDFSLGSSLIIPAGTVTTIDVYADAKTATTGNIPSGTVQITLDAGTSNGQGQSSLLSVNIPNGSAVSANALTVASSALTATAFSGYGNQTVVAGTNGARLGSFTLSAGSTEGINVNTIALSLAGYANVTNLSLKDRATGVTLGSITTSPAATGNTYSVNFTIPASGTKTIDVYGNVLSTATTSSAIQATVTSTGTTGTGSVTATSATLSADKALQTMTIGSGTLTTALGASNPVNTNVIAGGTTPVQVADFTFAAQVSPFTVDKLILEIPNGVATSTSGITIKYTNPAVNGITPPQQTVSQAVSVLSTASSTVTFTGLNFIVPKNDQNDLQVWVSIPSISNGAVSGAGISVTLMGTANNGFRATDSASNVITSVSTNDITGGASNKGTVYVRKSIPTVAMQTLTATTPVAGQAIYRLNVTADAAGAVDLDQLTFKVSTSTATVSGFTLYDVTGGTVTALNAAVVEATTAGVVKIPFDSLQQIGAGQTKTYELRPAIVSGWAAGAAVTVSLEQDTTAITNAVASTLTSGNNTVWSDRSAAGHSISTGDWTNGNLLKDFVTDVTSFNY